MLPQFNTENFGTSLTFVKENVFFLYYRGNSKYHYYGIRVKPNSPLNQLSDDGSSIAVRQQQTPQKRYKPVSGQKNLDSQFEQNANNSASSNSDSTSPQVSLEAKPVNFVVISLPLLQIWIY